MHGGRQPRNLTHLVSQVEHRLTTRLRVALEPEGCSVEEWRVMDVLSDTDGHTMTELAEYALLLAPTLTKLVDRLVSDNLVYRRADVEDRRRVRAYLTPRGQDRHRRLSRLVSATEAELPEARELAERLGEFADSLTGRARLRS